MFHQYRGCRRMNHDRPYSISKIGSNRNGKHEMRLLDLRRSRSSLPPSPRSFRIMVASQHLKFFQTLTLSVEYMVVSVSRLPCFDRMEDDIKVQNKPRPESGWNLLIMARVTVCRSHPGRRSQARIRLSPLGAMCTKP